MTVALAVTDTVVTSMPPGATVTVSVTRAQAGLGTGPNGSRGPCWPAPVGRIFAVALHSVRCSMSPIPLMSPSQKPLCISTITRVDGSYSENPAMFAEVPMARVEGGRAMTMTMTEQMRREGER
eukprot:2729820-Rhodomonas_salina.2